MHLFVFLSLIASVELLPARTSAAEDRREISPTVMGRGRHYFVDAFRKAYGTNAERTTYVACTSTDSTIGLNDFYLFRPRPPAAPVLVYYNRGADEIGNYGTVFVENGRIDMWVGNGAVGTAEEQRIVVEPLLAETPVPAGNIADAFKPRPSKNCAFAASEYFKRSATPAAK
jgi:hypothetical protein